MISMLSFAMCLLAASLFYVNEPVVDMRETPSNATKVVSQTRYSEEVIVQDKSGDWVSILTPDGYTGWILSGSLANLSEPYDANISTCRLKSHVYGVKDTEYGPIKSLPYGSKLKSIDSTDPRWIKIITLDGKESYIQKGDVISESKILQKSDLPQFSQQFLGLPYTWGGRSSFGYDCSGFVQMLYSQMGINLLRDSKQQVLDDRFQTVSLDALEPGDLIFFGPSSPTVRHVGMYIGNNQFIHSTVRENQPWIRISSLSDFDWSGNNGAYYPYRIARQLK